MFRKWIKLVEASYYRGSRLAADKTRRSTLSFTDDPTIASVYASHPETKAYVPGSRVTRADFEFKKPLDLSADLQIDLNTALGEAGLGDASDHPDVVFRLVAELAIMHDQGNPFHFEIANNLNWEDLGGALLKAARYAERSDDWSRFFDLLDYTVVDTYAICDTKTYVQIAKAHGFDGIIHLDSFHAGQKVAASLLGKETADQHLTYRPFNPVQWRA